jgi:hypothetical protein
MAPKPNALIKTRTEDKFIRPLINNIRATSFKLPNVLTKSQSTNKINIQIRHQKLQRGSTASKQHPN